MANPAIAELGEKTRFPSGRSGNPGGRPKGASTRARELAGGDPDKYLQVLVSIADNPKEKASDRIRAVQELLDRGWGKAPTYAPIEGDDPLELDDVNRFIAARLDELAARRASKAGGHGKGGSVDQLSKT